MFDGIQKAVAGVVTPVVTFAVGWVVLRLALDLDPDLVATINTALAAAITGWVVHRIPNTWQLNGERRATTPSAVTGGGKDSLR